MGSTRGGLRATSSSTAVTRQRGLLAEEQIQHEMVLQMVESLHAEQQEREQEMEQTMMEHNKIMSDEHLLAEMNQLDSVMLEEEQQKQKEAYQQKKREEEIKNGEEVAKIQYELDQAIVQQTAENTKYETLMKQQKEVRERDAALIQNVDLLEKQHQKLQDKIRKEMHDHMHGHDELAAKEDEKISQELYKEEMKLQKEYQQKKMAEQTKEEQEFIRQQEKEQHMIDALMGRAASTE